MKWKYYKGTSGICYGILYRKNLVSWYELDGNTWICMNLLFVELSNANFGSRYTPKYLKDHTDEITEEEAFLEML